MLSNLISNFTKNQTDIQENIKKLNTEVQDLKNQIINLNMEIMVLKSIISTIPRTGSPSIQPPYRITSGPVTTEPPPLHGAQYVPSWMPRGGNQYQMPPYYYQSVTYGAESLKNESLDRKI